MRFVLNDDFDENDDSWFDGIAEKYNQLSDEEKQRVNDWLDGNTDRIVDPKKFKVFLQSISMLKEYLKIHSSGYTMDINQKKGIATIQLDRICFNNVEEIKQIVSAAHHLTIQNGGSVDEDKVEIVIEYDLISEFR